MAYNTHSVNTGNLMQNGILNGTVSVMSNVSHLQSQMNYFRISHKSETSCQSSNSYQR